MNIPVSGLPVPMLASIAPTSIDTEMVLNRLVLQLGQVMKSYRHIVAGAHCCVVDGTEDSGMSKYMKVGVFICYGFGGPYSGVFWLILAALLSWHYPRMVWLRSLN